MHESTGVSCQGQPADQAIDFRRASNRAGPQTPIDSAEGRSKFVVDRQGRVVARYAPSTTPQRIEKDLEDWLGQAEA